MRQNLLSPIVRPTSIWSSDDRVDKDGENEATSFQNSTNLPDRLSFYRVPTLLFVEMILSSTSLTPLGDP